MVDPSNPGTLYRIDLQTNPDDPQQPEFRALPSAIFCAGQSWDKAGRLVVAGGQPLNPMLPSTTAYKFDPNALASATITPGSPIVLTEGGPRIWDALGPMAIGRYYPTLITLNKDPVLLSDAHACTNPDPRDGSSSLILGGPPLVTNEGNEFWEMHSPRLTNWYCPLVPEGLSSTSGGHWPSGGLPHDDFSLHPDTDPPEPLLDTYPRAFQTEVGGRIFVAGDTDTANSPPNAPGSSWVIKLRYDSGNPDSQLWRGPTTASVPGPDPTFDRFYDSVVLLHEFDQNGPKPGRIITFGGSYDSKFYQTGGPAWVVNDEARELEQAATTDPYVEGMWRTKRPNDPPSAPMGFEPFQRVYANAIVLPTGEIFLEGGSSTDVAEIHPKLVGAESGTPVDIPIIYNPGLDAIDQGSYRLMAQNIEVEYQPGIFDHTARLYHQVALLLLDGRVFVAGGHQFADNSTRPDPRFSGEIFSPPYFFEDKPLIEDVDGVIDFGATFQVQVKPDDINDPIDRIVLLKSGSVTHHTDYDQRYIELPFSLASVPPGSIPFGSVLFDVVAPDTDLGPAGYYMLFVVEDNGTMRVPSTGTFVKLR